MRCPKCKTPNPDTSPICSRCGAALQSTNAPQATNAPPSMSAPPVALDKPSLEKSVPVAQSNDLSASSLSLDGAPVDETAPYRPSGRWNLAGLVLLAFAGAVAAVLVGLLYFFISQFINFIIIFALVAGGLVGGLMTIAVKRAYLRNPKLVGCVAFASGLLMMGTMHMARAYSTRPLMIDEFVSTEIADLNAAKKMAPAQQTKVEQDLRSDISAYLTPWRTLVIYEQIAGESGSSLGRGGSSSSAGIPIQGKVYWALRIAEILLAALACAAIASSAASEPFCEACDKWQEKERLLRVHPRQNDGMWDKIRARDWAALLATPPDTPDDKHATTVTLTACPNCSKGTLGVTSIGGAVPAEFARRNLSADSVRALRVKSGTMS